MKALSSLACLFLALSPAVHSAPSEAEKPKPLAPAKSVFRFLSYDKDPKSAKTYVQVEHNGRSYFLEIGDIIPKTSFKIAKLEGEKLTLIDTVANETLVLPRGKVVDSAVVEAK